MMGAHVPVKPTALVFIDACGRHPVSFLIRSSDDSRWRNTQADGMPEAGGENLGLAAVLGNTEKATSRGCIGIARFEEVKVTLGIGFETGVVGVLATARVPVVADALVEIGFAIVIEVV